MILAMSLTMVPTTRADSHAVEQRQRCQRWRHCHRRHLPPPMPPLTVPMTAMAVEAMVASIADENYHNFSGPAWITTVSMTTTTMERREALIAEMVVAVAATAMMRLMMRTTVTKTTGILFFWRFVSRWGKRRCTMSSISSAICRQSRLVIATMAEHSA